MKTTIDNNNMNVEFKHWNTTVDPKTGVPRGALDAITLAIHDGGDSHMDALCHYAVESSKGPGKTERTEVRLLYDERNVRYSRRR